MDPQQIPGIERGITEHQQLGREMNRRFLSVTVFAPPAPAGSYADSPFALGSRWLACFRSSVLSASKDGENYRPPRTDDEAFRAQARSSLSSPPQAGTLHFAQPAHGTSEQKRASQRVLRAKGLSLFESAGADAIETATDKNLRFIG
jgi:hypothetical protein